ncbi:formate dehydrogenase subunit delta [Curvibacter sp. HBC28]|uniref:Formate dehydrogenase subunit delta n=1 Tax=Curvibacter microcysteis TaxID=3026419 RepID=A0ABT5MGZ0_9BURK|nr:formate dehydrogenase subunit delta [Curvibacter sp. HBC28]MDD0815843.1 formate dehydrogenase subunit delta [Curvibacter sp. HBC28]
MSEHHTSNLIVMANRIGQFFESMPDRPEALQGIANHIRKFWEPRMRAEFQRLMDDPAQPEVRDIVRQAWNAHRALLCEALPAPT